MVLILDEPLRGLFEEVAWPLWPSGLLWFRAEVHFQLHSNLKRFEPRSSNYTGNFHSFRHLYYPDGVGCHVFELWRCDMDDSVGDQFSPWAKLDPFHLCVPAVRADASRRDHHVTASDASDRHELPLATVLVERVDSRVWTLAHDHPSPSQCEPPLWRPTLRDCALAQPWHQPPAVSQPARSVEGTARGFAPYPLRRPGDP